MIYRWLGTLFEWAFTLLFLIVVILLIVNKIFDLGWLGQWHYYLD